MVRPLPSLAGVGGDLRARAAGQFCLDHLSTLMRRNGQTFARHAEGVADVLRECCADPSLIIVALLHDLPAHPFGDLLLSEAGLRSEEHFLIQEWHRLQETAPKRHKFPKDWLPWSTSSDPRLQLLTTAHHVADIRSLGSESPGISTELHLWMRRELLPVLRRARLLRWANEVEDRCFLTLSPHIALPFQAQYVEFRASAEPCMQRTVDVLSHGVRSLDLPYEISSRVKSLSSAYAKMVRNRSTLPDLYDFLGVRILVPSTISCYRILDWIHEHLSLVRGRHFDFIRTPKPSGYRSLHTVVVAPTEEEFLVEIQVRTEEMHWESEYGAANHLDYKRSCAVFTA